MYSYRPIAPNKSKCPGHLWKWLIQIAIALSLLNPTCMCFAIIQVCNAFMIKLTYFSTAGIMGYTWQPVYNNYSWWISFCGTLCMRLLLLNRALFYISGYHNTQWGAGQEQNMVTPKVSPSVWGLAWPNSCRRTGNSVEMICRLSIYVVCAFRMTCKQVMCYHL